MESHWALQAFLWIFFPLVLVLFSVGFVQLVSIHAIGKLIDKISFMYYLLSLLSLSLSHTHTHTHTRTHYLSGSGIPEMKTVLRGVNLPNYLSFRAFISKTVALITAVGSTLPIGKEVYICVCVCVCVCVHTVYPFVSLSLSLSLSLCLSHTYTQGPFVHISSIIADLMSRLISKYVRIFNHVFAVSQTTN